MSVGGEIDVASGSAYTKITNAEIETLTSFDFSAESNVTITADAVNFVYVDYNGGTPQIDATIRYVELILEEIERQDAIRVRVLQRKRKERAVK